MLGMVGTPPDPWGTICFSVLDIPVVRQALLKGLHA